MSFFINSNLNLNFKKSYLYGNNRPAILGTNKKAPVLPGFI